MVLIKLHLYISLFFILLTYQSSSVYSIQCCIADSTCPAKAIDCPSNVCFKLIISPTSEERGCMKDLIRLINPSGDDNPRSPDESGSSNDKCQKIDTQPNGMSLCKCTSDFCNSSSKSSYFSLPLFLSLVFVVNQYSYVFLS